MNWTEEKCLDCKQPFLMSFDEKKQFAKGWCSKCISPQVRHIRAKIVMGFYDIESIDIETANKLVEKDLKTMERRHYPREVINENP